MGRRTSSKAASLITIRRDKNVNKNEQVCTYIGSSDSVSDLPLSVFLLVSQSYYESEVRGKASLSCKFMSRVACAMYSKSKIII